MKYLKIHSLEKGWRDRDSIMLHAAFQILVDFVELEEPGKIVDWNSDERAKILARALKVHPGVLVFPGGNSPTKPQREVAPSADGCSIRMRNPLVEMITTRCTSMADMENTWLR